MSNTEKIDCPSYFIYDTPFGKITILSNGAAITSLYFGSKELPADFGRTKPTDLAAEQINEYFTGRRKSFDMIIRPSGTPFQKTVWAALQTIPYGETRSYQEIAKMLGNTSACRAVGMANNKNPLPLIIPCHRVIGSDGSLVGYAAGLETKRKLIKLEKSNTNAKI